MSTPKVAYSELVRKSDVLNLLSENTDLQNSVNLLHPICDDEVYVSLKLLKSLFEETDADVLEDNGPYYGSRFGYSYDQIAEILEKVSVSSIKVEPKVVPEINPNSAEITGCNTLRYCYLKGRACTLATSTGACSVTGCTMSISGEIR